MFPASFDAQSKFAGFSLIAKLCWVICISIWILLIQSGIGQIILLISLMIINLYDGLEAGDIARTIRLFLPVFAIVFLLHLFYHPGEIIFRIWFLKATMFGLKAAVFNLVRFVNFIILY